MKLVSDIGNNMFFKNLGKTVKYGYFVSWLKYFIYLFILFYSSFLVLQSSGQRAATAFFSFWNSL